ncbi:uncharacterized protein Z519_04136 [Cladophialophora bantiana CBS 173.52]|uniref:Uncharacterized protein n=1 Tax=Cladophialophora bantiana (strain ATCC 10958 / CBS 173.52 / CDC B-1940 / NIH 8579) TaxID=1442370 RepID=A0A0D2F053_CLAB1|nr:uncharacterized protein Z519_04136 [Cladophialophora bantiana CBS 173.52]KIW95551.1 hypothetical protein Z519_04136 [Cladophialophora bantiana CBS 173.52]
MPIKHAHSSDDVLPSFTSRLVHKVSSSLGTFKVKKQASSDREEIGRLRNQRSLRHTTKFCYNETICNRELVKQSAAFHTDATNDRRAQPSTERSGEIEPLFDGGTRSQRGFRSHTLKAVPEVDASPIAPDRSRRKTIAFVGNRLDQEVKQVRADTTPVKKARGESSATCSDMHRVVDSDDYLLARGANPRTGVVTPGSRSASSSIDRNQNDLSRVGRQVPSSRWRQRGDQWISMDLDEPTSPSTSPTDRPREHQYQALRTPQKLATRGERDPLLDHGKMQSDHPVNPSHGRGATDQFHQDHLGASVKAERLQSGVEQAISQDNQKLSRPIKRKPVGSTPGRSNAEPVSHPQRGTNESTDTVLRNPKFSSEVRSSSAPDHPRGHLFPPHTVKKTLPRTPTDGSENGSQTADDSFLGLSQTGQQVDVPSSKTSNISGRHSLEKELPCLPTNNGLYQSTSDMTLYPTTPKGENEATMPMRESPTVRIAASQGPRDGDLVYPYIRTARLTYPAPPTARHIKRLGERVVPFPIYDNPLRRLSPLMRTTGPKVESPRVPSPREMMVSRRTRPGLVPFPNITTIPTDISTGGPHPPRPQPPDQRLMMNRGQYGFRWRPPPSDSTDIITNTTMNMYTDTMMSIPMPRIRPRAMTRPPLPTRAEGMYGVPGTAPTCNRSDQIDIDARRPWTPSGMPSGVELVAREDLGVAETNPIPKSLKSRLQPFQGPSMVNDLPLEHAEMSPGGFGLMRKCSNCNHGFVGVKLHNTDSVTPTSALQKNVDKPSEGAKYLHPKGSPIPRLPQDRSPQQNGQIQHEMLTLSHKSVDVVDERDHSICCPECCKLDCHEGCLGHPSSTCASTPTKSLWLEAQSSTSSCEPETQEEVKAAGTEGKGKFTRLAAVRSVLKRSPKKEEQSKSGSHIQVALSKVAPVELSMQPPIPATSARYDSVKRLPDAVAAALGAMELPSHKRRREALTAAFSGIGPSQQTGSASRPIIHRRQRSSSLPILGIGVTSRRGSGNAQYQRATSGGSWLRIPSPLGSVMSCSNSSKDGSWRSRNVSTASITTFELQVPSFASLTACGSCAVVGDVLLIPLQAARMWIRNHPHILAFGREVVQGAWIMTQLMMRTGWRLWATVFVYSKTGKIKFYVSKGETAGGFVLDLARSLLYLITFAAVSTLVIRVLGLVIWLLGIIGWVVRAVFWVLKGIMGVGQVR